MVGKGGELGYQQISQSMVLLLLIKKKFNWSPSYLLHCLTSYRPDWFFKVSESCESVFTVLVLLLAYRRWSSANQRSLATNDYSKSCPNTVFLYVLGILEFLVYVFRFIQTLITHWIADTCLTCCNTCTHTYSHTQRVYLQDTVRCCAEIP